MKFFYSMQSTQNCKLVQKHKKLKKCHIVGIAVPTTIYYSMPSYQM